MQLLASRWLWGLMILVLGLSSCGPRPRKAVKLLVFPKTAGYRHASIEDGIAALQKMGAAKGWQIDTTEDATRFTEEILQQYSAVIFVSTTGDVLDHYQQADFERYIQGGGGYVGIHAASDTEYNWPWYGRLVGAYFKGHPNNPNVRTADMHIVNNQHPSTSFWDKGATWQRTDEFYNFKDIYHGPADGIVSLIEIDENSYEGGENGDFHPMTWYHNYDGGRAWYTNFGHTAETFLEPDFLKMLEGGLEYAIGKNLPIDYAKATSLRVPPAYRFRVETLADNLNEPMELEFLPDGRILWTQRRGEIMLLDPTTSTTQQVGELAVWTKFEDGLVGLALDPDYVDNSWLYLYYAPEQSDPLFRLSRFVFKDDSLHMATEKVVLEVPVQRDTCCHTGGSIEFGPDGLLYLSTGDDTNPFETRYAPIDERPGKEPWDAQRSSGNPSDLRGKILRIRPLADGSYEIPENNLFPADGSKGRPEIYVMGCRNPYRIAIDPETNYLYWGDVGPDGRIDSTRGPRGYDEVNQARKAGFFGWPYFIGNNYAYTDVDFTTQTERVAFNPDQPINDTRHNTGTQQLPPAQPAFIWYPYASSPDFPVVAEGGRNAMAGPVYHYEAFQGTSSQFPRYYDDKLFVYDFMRDWVLLAKMNEAGDLETLEPFLENEAMGLSSPVDMAFGSDGALYILNYGTQWFAQNVDASLIRIEYSEANRAPMAIAQADPVVGGAPLTVNFSGSKTMDYDPGDRLTFNWKFPDGTAQAGENLSYTFKEPGVYTVTMQVTDTADNVAEAPVEIRVGNALPAITLELAGNKQFFWKDKPIAYRVEVVDEEDGSLSAGDIAAEKVSVRWTLGEDAGDAPAELGHKMEAEAENTGEALILANGCIACHGMEEANIGPGYAQVAQKYYNPRRNRRRAARDYLTHKILNGSSGVWGKQAMPAMSQLSRNEARTIAEYILSLGENKDQKELTPEGRVYARNHNGLGEKQLYTLQVSYQDRGGAPIGPLSSYLRHNFYSPKIEWERYVDLAGQPDEGAVWVDQERDIVSYPPGTSAPTLPVDLTGVKALTLRCMAYNGVCKGEVRLDSPDGPLLGEITLTPGEGEPQFSTHRIAIPAQEGQHRIYIVHPQAEGQSTPPAFVVDWGYLQAD